MFDECQACGRGGAAHALRTRCRDCLAPSARLDVCGDCFFYYEGSPPTPCGRCAAGTELRPFFRSA